MQNVVRIVAVAALLLGALAAPTSDARFLSVDPVQPDAATGEQFNRYHYADDNPYRFTDPDGRQAKEMLRGGFRLIKALIDGPPKSNKAPDAPKPPSVAPTGKDDAPPPTRAGHNDVQGPAQVESRTTRSGGDAATVTYPDGSVKDVSRDRVKEFLPQTHPNAPAGTLQRVKFPDAQPGTKGLKRDPTPSDLKDAGLQP